MTSIGKSSPRAWGRKPIPSHARPTPGCCGTNSFTHYVVEDWLDGDPNMPPPPPGRRDGRNADWRHLFNRDVLSMPDKWEYPWYASWDTAFHMICFARIDPEYTKRQLIALPAGMVHAPERQDARL